MIFNVFQGNHLDDASYTEDVHVTVGPDRICHIRHLTKTELKCLVSVNNPGLADEIGTPAIEVNLLFILSSQ